MRLIDADALKKVMEEIYFSDKWLDFRVNRGSNGVRDVILDLVTYTPAVIIERPTGEWVQTEIIDDDAEYGVNDDASECSNCKHIESSHYWTTTYYNYCPNCGAKMRKGEEE